MDDYRAILKRVGYVLIVAGLLDVAVMVYCIVNHISYSSSFNIFAVVAGIFLIRGSLGAVYWVTFISALMLPGVFIGAVVFPFVRPIAFWMAEFRVNPVGTMLLVVAGMVVAALLVWVYAQLRRKPVLQARMAEEKSASPPWLAFVLGTVMAVVVSGFVLYMTQGALARHAVALAESKYGSQYQYLVTSMQWSNGYSWARLTAYNDHVVKQVDVSWGPKRSGH